LPSERDEKQDRNDANRRLAVVFDELVMAI